MHPPCTSDPDGEFVIFDNHDLPGHEVAYYPEHRNNIKKLKELTLTKRCATLSGFSSLGSLKSWVAFDKSKLQRTPGCSLYVRVQRPGWTFVQGMDSFGNDMDIIPNPRDPNALINAIEAAWPDDDTNERIAAFNTLGLIKSEVTYPLCPDPGSFPTPLDGIYIRVNFRSFCYTPREPRSFDPSIDIECNKPGNITKLIELTKPRDNADGFCTDGRIQSCLTDQAFSTRCIAEGPHLAPRGSYVRIGWRDFTYYPGLTSDGHVTQRLESGQPFHKLVSAARRGTRVVAFCADGSLMESLGGNILDCDDSTPEPSGIYVKIPQLEERYNEEGSTFILWTLKAMGYGLLKALFYDAEVRREYVTTIERKSIELLAELDGHGPAFRLEGYIEYAERAVEIRNECRMYMRKRDTFMGKSFAEQLKPVGGTAQNLFNKYARSLTGKDFAKLSVDEKKLVMREVMKASGRSNPWVTFLAGKLTTALSVIHVGLSIYSVAVANEWLEELGRQVSWWLGDILGNRIGVGVCSFAGPSAAVLCGITGGLIGSSIPLANYFLGGTSQDSTRDLLGARFTTVRREIRAYLNTSSHWFHIHQIYESDRAGGTSTIAGENIKRMVYRPTTTEVGKNVLATLVWVESENEGLIGANPSNPGDLIALLNWVTHHLPTPQ